MANLRGSDWRTERKLPVRQWGPECKTASTWLAVWGEIGYFPMLKSVRWMSLSDPKRAFDITYRRAVKAIQASRLAVAKNTPSAIIVLPERRVMMRARVARAVLDCISRCAPRTAITSTRVLSATQMQPNTMS